MVTDGRHGNERETGLRQTTSRKMSDKEVHLTACIHYYCLNKFYRSMQTCCSEGMRLFPGEQRFRLYYGLSLYFEGRMQESIRELDAVHGKEELRLAASLAMIHAHRKHKTIDTETIHQLEGNVRDKRKSASDTAIALAAMVLLCLDKSDKANDYVEKLLGRSTGSGEGRMVKGWINLMKDGESDSSFFNEAARAGDPEALLGKAMSYMKIEQFHKAMETLNNLLSTSPSFQPAVMEKMRAALAIRDWDQVLDSSSKCQALDRHSVQGLRYWILIALVQQDDDHLLSKLSDFSTSLELREPKSAHLHLESARLFSRLCQRNTEVMKFATSLADRSSYIDANSQISVLCELGYQCLLLSKFKDAERHYKAANKLKASDMDALIGLLRCSYMENPNSDEVMTNLETFEELKKSSDQGIPQQLLHLCALTAERRGKSSDQAVQLLDQLSSNYLKHLKHSRSLSLELYASLEPDFVVDVVRLYLDFAPADPIAPGQAVPHVLSQAQAMLDPVASACASHKDPLYCMAEIKFLAGHSPSALSLLDKCLDRDENFPLALLLKAKIQLHAGHFKASEQSLDIALSRDFKIREMTDYVIVNACLLKQAKKYEDAITCLKNGLDRIDVHKSRFKTFRETQQKITMSFLLAQLYDHLDQNFDSEKILTELEEEFKETALSGRIMIAKAVSAENKGALDEALTILRTVGNEKEEYFILSRQMMANIYLKYRNDRRLYAGCHKEICDKIGTKAAFLQLGDAYMNILEPEQAVQVYEQCLKKNPKDPYLTRKVGQALVKSHFFDKAITYYKASIKTSSADVLLNISLKYDLADLLYRMKRYQEAKSLIKGAMEQIEEHEKGSFEVREWEVKLIFLMAQMQSVVDQKEIVITSLKRAYSLLTILVRRIQVEKPDAVDEFKNLLIVIGTQLADLVASHSKSYPEALTYYKELLNFEPKNVRILTALANLELQQNNFESAQSFTSMILKYAPDDDESALMMIDVMMNRNDMEGAFDQLAQFLDRKPNHYLALSRQVQAAKRLGKLPWIANHIQTLLRMHPSCETDPKFCFCRGVYQKLTNDSRSALVSLYKCRADPVFGERSLILLIEICLNPENEVIGGTVLDSQASNPEQHVMSEGNLKTATRLLDDLLSKNGESLQYHFLKCFAFLVRRHRSDLEQAIQGFNDLLRDDPECQEAMFGIATAHALASQTHKVKTTLKKLLKQEWKNNDPDTLERAKLLMVDVYIQTNKNEPAKEMIRQILLANKSCIKAYEYAGHLMEKDSHYDEASENYKVAYELCCRRNAIVGYKLAFNLLKGKHYSAAVDVGREVLAIYPDYPRLKEEIVDRALNARLQLY